MSRSAILILSFLVFTAASREAAGGCSSALRNLLRSIQWKEAVLVPRFDRSQIQEVGSLAEFYLNERLHPLVSIFIGNRVEQLKGDEVSPSNPINPSAAALYKRFSEYLKRSNVRLFTRRSEKLKSGASLTADDVILSVRLDRNGKERSFQADISQTLYQLLFNFLIDELHRVNRPEVYELVDELFEAYQDERFDKRHFVSWLRSVLQLRSSNELDLIRSLQELRAATGFLNTITHSGRVVVVMSDETRLSNRQKIPASFDFSIMIQEDSGSQWIAQLVEVKQVGRFFKASEIHPALKSAVEKLKRESDLLQKRVVDREGGAKPRSLSELSARNSVVVQVPWNFESTTEFPDQTKMQRTPDGRLLVNTAKASESPEYKEVSILMDEVIKVLNGNKIFNDLDELRITDLDGNLVHGFYRYHGKTERVDIYGNLLTPGAWHHFKGTPRLTFVRDGVGKRVELDFIEFLEQDLEELLDPE